MLSSAGPFPSMLICTPAYGSNSRYCGLVKWLPWSLFQMTGRAWSRARRAAQSTKGKWRVSLTSQLVTIQPELSCSVAWEHDTT
jgi:hypothetical protein